MNYKYFQLPRSVFQNILHLNYTHVYATKRWAGHAKWQNVKADKENSAKFKSIHFSKLTKEITLAVKESGDNPSTNTKLKNLIEASRKLSMTNSTIQKAIDRGKGNIGAKPYWVGYTGPSNIQVALEVTYPQQHNIQSDCGTKLRKIGLKMEKNLYDICDVKGIIVCNPLKDVTDSFDQAMEDGITIGANDVFEMKDQTLVFECSPDRVDSLESQLSKKGYEVQSSGTEVEFHVTTKLAEDDLEKLEEKLEKLIESHHELQRFSHNVQLKNTE